MSLQALYSLSSQTTHMVTRTHRHPGHEQARCTQTTQIISCRGHGDMPGDLTRACFALTGERRGCCSKRPPGTLWAACGQVRTRQAHLAIREAADAGLHSVAWRDIQGRCDDSRGRRALREVHLPKGDGLACLRQARGRLSAHAHIQPVPHSPDSVPAGRQAVPLAKGAGYNT